MSMPLSLSAANEDEDGLSSSDSNELTQDVEDVTQSHRQSSSRRANNHDTTSTGPSNECILSTAFYSFFIFAITQLAFAFVAGSQAMKGDSAAMIVDAITYLFNGIAERCKNRSLDDEQLNDTSDTTKQQQENVAPSDPVEEARTRKRNRRKTILKLEIIPPVISIITLVSVTIYVIHKSVTVLILDMHRSRAEQSVPNLKIMLSFSSINLVLDILNVSCFARAKHLLGYATVEPVLDHSSCPPKLTTTISRVDTNISAEDNDEDDDDICADLCLHRQGRPENGDRSVPPDHYHNHKDRANLNMCSAYTHVFADTLRSLAVILAVCLALIFDEVTPEVADATAAVVVSILILLSLLPLIKGLAYRVAALRAIWAKERSQQQRSTTPMN